MAKVQLLYCCYSFILFKKSLHGIWKSQWLFLPLVTVWDYWHAWWLGREFGCYNCQQNKRWWTCDYPSWRLSVEGKKWGNLRYFAFGSIIPFLMTLFLKIYVRSVIQISAAHICYLVAEANFEAYSDSARLCLIGADHWKSPRTYASPEAIQVLF